jgi:hypothetical protein
MGGDAIAHGFGLFLLWSGRRLRELGWAGALGFALLAFATAFLVSGVWPVQDRLAGTRSSLLDLQSSLRRPGTLAPGPRQRVDAFYQRFGDDASLPELLIRLHGYALARGVNSRKADYRESAETGTPLVRVVVTLPVTASFEALRAWLADISAEVPGISLESLRVSREGIDKPDVEAEARFFVFLRRAR